MRLTAESAVQHPWCLGIAYEEYKQLLLQQMLHDDAQLSAELHLEEAEANEIAKDLFNASERTQRDVDRRKSSLSASLTEKLQGLSVSTVGATANNSVTNNPSISTVASMTPVALTREDSDRLPAPPSSPTVATSQPFSGSNQKQIHQPQPIPPSSTAASVATLTSHNPRQSPPLPSPPSPPLTPQQQQQQHHHNHHQQQQQQQQQHRHRAQPPSLSEQQLQRMQKEAAAAMQEPSHLFPSAGIDSAHMGAEVSVVSRIAARPVNVNNTAMISLTSGEQSITSGLESNTFASDLNNANNSNILNNMQAAQRK